MLRKTVLFFVILTVIAWPSKAQVNSDSSITFLFAGDIMGHDAQIASAYDSISDSYQYDDVFSGIKPLLEKPDFSIANLELTLAGKPFTGYPQFSSPDELATACLKNGIDVLVTANNHSCDRGKTGIIRTLDVLDSIGMKHTGTFRDPIDRENNNLLILQNSHLKVGLLNYTYGTNGIPAPSPTIVNLIDYNLIAQDIEKAKNESLDELIVMLHWGLEYQKHPNPDQEKLVTFLKNLGINIIIGSHPHVVQRMDYFPADSLGSNKLIVYSLGNLVSNQRKRATDGGVMVEFTLKKEKGRTSISEKGYYLTWVDKTRNGNKAKFEILPCKNIEDKSFESIEKPSEVKMRTFMEDTRELLNERNTNFEEIDYSF
jgi:poly-gamma-glutamate capsule biosynthesis protein CapA/YwtB (metallophosphatase superfamily)